MLINLQYKVFQRLTLESWYSKLKQTFLNRCQQLPAPYITLFHPVETEEVNLTPESQQQSRRNIQINSVSQQSLNLSFVCLHSAKRRYDILNLTVSLIMDKRKDFSLCIYEFSPIIFKLV